MDNFLKKKTLQFLRASGISIGYLSRHVDLSITSISLWLNNKRELSEKSQNRIAQFMADYTLRLVEIAK